MFFADGSSQPLRAWSLSHEYGTWPKGESPARGVVGHRQSDDLRTGKKAVPTAGLLLEVECAPEPAQRVVKIQFP